MKECTLSIAQETMTFETNKIRCLTFFIFKFILSYNTTMTFISVNMRFIKFGYPV